MCRSMCTFACDEIRVISGQEARIGPCPSMQHSQHHSSLASFPSRALRSWARFHPEHARSRSKCPPPPVRAGQAREPTNGAKLPTAKGGHVLACPTTFSLPLPKRTALVQLILLIGNL